MTDTPHETADTLVEARDSTDRELAHKNMVWGWALFGLFWVLFLGTAVVALVYLWLD